MNEARPTFKCFSSKSYYYLLLAHSQIDATQRHEGGISLKLHKKSLILKNFPPAVPIGAIYFSLIIYHNNITIRKFSRPVRGFFYPSKKIQPPLQVTMKVWN